MDTTSEEIPHSQGREDFRVRSLERYYVPALWLLILLAAAVRLHAITLRGFWFDEFCSIWVATSPRGILEELQSDTNPPLYFFLLKGWVTLFGLSESAVRGLSLVCSLLFLLSLPRLASAFCFARTAGLWAVLIGAAAPVQIFYGAEARAYSLVCLLLSLSLTGLALGIRTGKLGPWLLHGVFALLALYTHNLSALALAAVWPAAAFLRPNRRGWLRLLLTHVFVGLAYLPWLLRLGRQSDVAGLEFIAAFFAGENPAFLIPRSLQVLGLAPLLPSYVVLPSPPEIFQWAGLFWLLLIGWGALTADPSREERETPPSPPANGMNGAKPVWALVVLVLIPLLLLLAYSLVRTPLYLLGRYDVLVSPPWLLFLGAGVAGAVQQLSRLPGESAPRLRLLPVVLAGILAVGSIGTLWAQKPKSGPTMEQVRGELLRRNAHPGDVIVALGWEPVTAGYLIRRYQLPVELVSFPASTLRHPGWFSPNEVLQKEGTARLQQEARALAQRLAAARSRIWLIGDPKLRLDMRPSSPKDGYLVIARTLLDELSRFQPLASTVPTPGFQDLFPRAGMHLLAPPPADR